MAKVKFPLWSLSASGSLGKTVCYSPQAEEASRQRDRVIKDTDNIAIYPARIISGRAIARLKPRGSAAIRRQSKIYKEPESLIQAQRQAQFTFAQTLARWIIENNLTVSPVDPLTRPEPVYPWTDGRYFLRGENREIRKFPGQVPGKTLGIRRRTTRPTTEFGYVMRQLITRRNFRFNITLIAWTNLPNPYVDLWLPSGNAPWDNLPRTFPLHRGIIVDRTFANMWMQASFLIPRFELQKNWLEAGTQNGMWISTDKRADNDPVILNWEKHLDSESDYLEQNVQSWKPTRPEK